MKIGLVLEGGANRGVFTSGVLDYFMEQDLGKAFRYVIGTSARHRSMRKQTDRERLILMQEVRLIRLCDRWKMSWLTRKKERLWTAHRKRV